MSNYEMPVAIRLNKEELAAALGRPVDDPDVQRLGGMNVVLHAISSPVANNASLIANTAMTATVSALHDALAPLEEKLFQRLRSNPNTAKEFLSDPMGTMERLGLMDDAMRAKIAPHVAAMKSHLAANQ